jgi:S-methylmethionine-dependent homocysteine/selenocysteine methylase
MPAYRNHLPMNDAEVFLTDGGIETTLMFDDGFELPDFAAFPLHRDTAGREALIRYFEAYIAVATRDGVGIVLETVTWRANPDWAARLGYSLDDLAAVNREAVSLLEELRTKHQTPATPIVISGCIGPRGDGYIVGASMTPEEAKNYHALQTATFADTEADLVTAITMTYVDEAIGLTEAARAASMPVVISFTVETDGRLPSGQPLGEAIEDVDAATGSYPAYYMVNCAHPTHFAHAFNGSPAWAQRLSGVRANASKMSHAELDETDELDRGDTADLAQHYRELRDAVPTVRVLGGCCGTDHTHIDAISTACTVAETRQVGGEQENLAAGA